jgi:hypothetical protein
LGMEDVIMWMEKRNDWRTRRKDFRSLKIFRSKMLRLLSRRSFANATAQKTLKDTLRDKIPSQQALVKDTKEKYGSRVLGGFLIPPHFPNKKR